MESDAFVSRTTQLLHCRFEKYHAYLIAVLPHGSWTRQKLIKTMHENWPDRIDQYRVRGSKGDRLADEEIAVLRKRHYNYCVDIEDGIAYLPIGGGCALSGKSTFVIMQADRILDWARRMQQKIIDDFPETENRARGRGILFSDPAVFKIHIIGKTFCAVEVGSGYTIPLRDP